MSRNIEFRYDKKLRFSRKIQQSYSNNHGFFREKKVLKLNKNI